MDRGTDVGLKAEETALWSHPGGKVTIALPLRGGKVSDQSRLHLFSETTAIPHAPNADASCFNPFLRRRVLQTSWHKCHKGSRHKHNPQAVIALSHCSPLPMLSTQSAEQTTQEKLPCATAFLTELLNVAPSWQCLHRAAVHSR